MLRVKKDNQSSEKMPLLETVLVSLIMTSLTSVAIGQNANFTGMKFLRSSATGHVCSDLVLLDFGDTHSALGCGRMCHENGSCHSFYYRAADGWCRGSSRYYNASVLSGCANAPGIVYFFKAPSSEGQSCTHHTDCFGYNVWCRESLCRCQLGYSLQPEINTCEPTCSVYGTTYTMNRDYTMVVAGSPVFQQSDVAFCKAQCTLDPTCRTMRYNINAGGCQIDPRTPLSHPDNCTIYIGVDLYMRNCAIV